MPDQIRGSKSQLRMYYQTAYDTLATGNGLRCPAVDIGITKTSGLIQSRVLQGNRSETEPSRDEITAQGPTTWQPDIRSWGYLLYLFSGDYAVAGPVGGLYTHTFKLGVLPVGATLEKWFSDAGFGYHYIGARPNTISWDIGTGGIQEASVDWVAQDEAYAAAPIDAAPLLQPVVGFRVPSVTLTQAGVALKVATRFGMSLTNNLEPSRVVGNAGVINGAPEGTFSATGTMDVQFNSHAQYQKALNDTEEAIIVTYPAPGGMSLQYLFDEVKYDVSAPVVTSGGGVTLPLNWRAFYNDAVAASAFRAILINDVASHASIA